MARLSAGRHRGGGGLGRQPARRSARRLRDLADGRRASFSRSTCSTRAWTSRGRHALMLRPTESPTLFLQQLGRGLRRRRQDTVYGLDFVGTHREEFRFRPPLPRPPRRIPDDVAAGRAPASPSCPRAAKELDRVARGVVLVASASRPTRGAPRSTSSALPGRPQGLPVTYLGRRPAWTSGTSTPATIPGPTHRASRRAAPPAPRVSFAASAESPPPRRDPARIACLPAPACFWGRPPAPNQTARPTALAHARRIARQPSTWRRHSDPRPRALVGPSPRPRLRSPHCWPSSLDRLDHLPPPLGQPRRAPASHARYSRLESSPRSA